MIQQAQSHLQQGQWALAEQDFCELIVQKPDEAEWHHLLGFCQAQQNKLEEAKNSLLKAVTLNPTQIGLHNSLGLVYLRLDDFSAAIFEFKQILQQQPHSISALRNLGNCYYKQNQFKQSIDYYEKALALEPNEPSGYVNLALAYAHTDQLNQAVTLLETAHKINPQHFLVNTQLAQFYILNKKFDQALPLLENAATQNPEHAETQHALGLIAFEKTNYHAAQKYFEKCLEINPEHGQAHFHLGNTFLQLGDLPNALVNFLRQIPIEASIDCYFNIGVVLLYQERHREAQIYFEQILRENPNHMATQQNLGLLFLRLQNFDRALQHYTQALQHNSEDAELRYIVQALSQQHRPSQAPNDYVKHLFDQYAPYYEQHLNQFLHYKVPEKMLAALITDYSPHAKQWQCLDLGCGTGLLGELLRPYCHTLIGIDLSPVMLEKARSKQLYDQLCEADIQQALTQFQQIDLIVAADVFMYLGDLNPIFAACAHSLKNGGLFLFSFEKTNAENYALEKTLRFTHNPKHVQALIQQYHFIERRFENCVLREQHNQPVEGYLVLLEKQE